jgi:hypothetical protein
MSAQLRKFKIYAPAFDQKSAGNMMLHFLNASLNDIGYHSDIVLFGEKISEQDQEKSIIIYPEIIHDNPLGAKNVARYLLHKDGALWGKKIEKGPNDYLFTYSRSYDPNAPILFYPLVDTSILTFSDNLDNRILQTVYFGKGKPLDVNLDGTVPHLFITRAWPDQKDQLVDFLKISRYFHCADSISTILIEALLCGATPIIHQWDERFQKEEYLNSELSEVYEIQFEGDYSKENTLKKSEKLRKKIHFYQINWSKKLVGLVEDMQNKFE